MFGPTFVAVVVYAVLASGAAPVPASLLVLVLALVLVPTSGALSRRLALNASLLLGIAPVLWSSPWPVPMNHAALLVAVASSGTAWRVLGAAELRVGFKSLVPRVCATDALVPAGGLLALALMWRWVVPRSPQQALEVMVPAVDNAAHFSMFSMVLRHGTATSALGPAPDGSPWGYGEYPQGFHSLVATISELLHPGVVAGEQLLVDYTQGVAVVIVLGMSLVTAALVSVPGLKGHLGIAAPVVGMTWAAYLWHPGQQLLADGFANFWLSAAAAGAALLMSLSVRRVATLPMVAGVAALLVCVVYAWAPLIVIAGPAVLALFLPRVRTAVGPGERTSTRHRLATMVILAVAAAWVVKPVVALFLDVGVSVVVVAGGGISSTGALQTLVLLAIGLVVLPAAPGLTRRRAAPPVLVAVAGRARVLTLTLVAGFATAVLMLVAQMRALGETSYYFLKFLMGFELVLASLIPAVVAVVAVAMWGGRPERSSRWPSYAVAVVATLLASQFFGVLRGPVATVDRAWRGTALLTAPFSAPGLAGGLLAATGRARRETGFAQDYLAIGPSGAAQAYYADNWYHALLGSQSGRVLTRADSLLRPVGDVGAAVPVARRMLREYPDTELVVAPAYAASLRARLGTRLGARVTTWRSDGTDPFRS